MSYKYTDINFKDLDDREEDIYVNGLLRGFYWGFIIAVLMSIGLFYLEPKVSAESDEKHFIKISEEAMAISHDFTATAHIEPNDCNTCIKEKQPSECLVVCEQFGKSLTN